MEAKIIIGANYGDEGKGTVVANYTKIATGEKKKVLNVLTNGGAQRGHSIIAVIKKFYYSRNVGEVPITFQHFGSGTYHGADSYYSCYFVLHPMQFVKEYKNLCHRPENLYRDEFCRWTTPFDSLANLIVEQALNRTASCRMGVFNTLKRYQIFEANGLPVPTLDAFVASDKKDQIKYLLSIKSYYETFIGDIPSDTKKVWNSPILLMNFINDCAFMVDIVKTLPLSTVQYYYDEIIFENGQGLLLCDTGKDTMDTTPSNTGILYAKELLSTLEVDKVEAHYVTRPYLTRHGDGEMLDSVPKFTDISMTIEPDRTNHYNEAQGSLRYGNLDIPLLKERILLDAKDVDIVLDVTHCDEMDRVSEFQKEFNKVVTYDTPKV